MVTQNLTEKDVLDTIEAVRIHGSQNKAATALGLSRAAVQNRLMIAKRMQVVQQQVVPEQSFEVGELPDELPTAEELIERRKRQFSRKQEAAIARKLIPVTVKLDGPIGLAIVGDPHVDDNGTDIELLEQHFALFRKHEALLPLGIGDYSNNWVGRLARLYGQQSLSAAEAWVLVEWLVRSVDWLVLVGGNHDAWSGDGDPIKWMAKSARVNYESNGARLGLNLPSGRTIRLNARHDFRGKSMWNVTHGIGKAAQFGWRDHLLTAGHTHESGWDYKIDPMTGLISHCFKVGSYKRYDRYADEKGLPDQNVSACKVLVVRPQFEDHDPKLLTPFLEPETAAEFLAFLRKRKSERAA